MSEFVLGQGPGHKLEKAIARNGGDTTHIEWLSSGENFNSVILLASGRAELVMKPPVRESAPSILELVSTIVVNAISGKFIAKERFVVNTDCNALVKISAVRDNFTNWFLSGDGKTEDSINEQTLRYHKLRKASVDGPIITELGGEAKAETTLSEIFSLMEKQKNGEDGVLLNNGYANIFYIRDQFGVLRAVFMYWFGDGWLVRAFSVERLSAWRGGCQVFSRNPLEPSETPDLA